MRDECERKHCEQAFAVCTTCSETHKTKPNLRARVEAIFFCFSRQNKCSSHCFSAHPNFMYYVLFGFVRPSDAPGSPPPATRRPPAAAVAKSIDSRTGAPTCSGARTNRRRNAKWKRQTPRPRRWRPRGAKPALCVCCDCIFVMFAANIIILSLKLLYCITIVI